MKRKNVARNALFTSVISLLLCVSMLVGTTFAWFTDTVETGRNVIAAGNLDIHVTTADGTSVEGATELFQVKNELWEPGAVAYETLNIQNVGSLALKYKMDLTVLSETVVGNAKLSDVIKVGVVEGALGDDTTREGLIGSISNWTSLSTFSLDMNNVMLVKDESDTVSIVLYWQPTDHDNDYNMNNENKGKELKLEIGLNVYATQVEHEFDSFPNNEYDAGASLSSTVSSNVRTDGSVSLTALNAPAVNNKKTVVEAPAGTYTEGQKVEMNITSSNSLFNITADGAVVGTLDVELIVDGKKQDDAIAGVYTVTTYISKGLNTDDVFVVYTGTDGKSQPTKVSYNSETGELVFTTNHFSQYTVSGKAYGYEKADDIAYTTVQAVVDAINNNEPVIVPDVHKAEVFGAANRSETVKAQMSTASIDGEYYLTAKEAFAASKEGNTITLKPGTYQFKDNNIKKDVTIEGTEGVVFNDTLSGTLNGVTIKNVDIKAGNAQRWAYASGDVLFEDCTFDATSVYAIHYDKLTDANITYKNCTIIGWAAIGSGAKHVTFDGCTIKGNGTYGLLRLYSPATIKDCTFDVANVNTTDVYQDGIHAVDTEIVVENCTNLNGDVTALFNTSGTGKITYNGEAYAQKGDGVQSALAEGGSVQLTSDAAYAGQIHVGKGGTLDGNGKTLTVSSGATEYESGLTVTQGTVKNVTVDGAYRGLGVGGSGASAMTGDVTYENVTVKGATYGVNIGLGGGHKLTMNSCTFGDWNSYSGLGSAEFNGCTFTSEGRWYASQRISANATFTYNNCEFKQNTYDNANGTNNYYLDSYGNGVIAMNNCTIEGVKITTENLLDYFQIDEKNNTTVIVDGKAVAINANQLAAAAKAGNDVVLSKDVIAPQSSKAIYGTPVAVIQKGGTFDGNGKTLDIENANNTGYAIETYGGTIKNLTINAAAERGIVISSPKNNIVIDNVVVDGPGYAINTTEHNGKKLIVTNSTFNGWSSLAGLESASFTNCRFGENTSKYWQNMGYGKDYDRLIRPYVSTTFDRCAFEMGFYIDLSALGAGCTVNLADCTVNGTKITATNYDGRITIELPAGRELADCVVFG